jgi:hypothetical protein
VRWAIQDSWSGVMPGRAARKRIRPGRRMSMPTWWPASCAIAVIRLPSRQACWWSNASKTSSSSWRSRVVTRSLTAGPVPRRRWPGSTRSRPVCARATRPGPRGVEAAVDADRRRRAGDHGGHRRTGQDRRVQRGLRVALMGQHERRVGVHARLRHAADGNDPGRGRRAPSRRAAPDRCPGPAAPHRRARAGRGDAEDPPRSPARDRLLDQHMLASGDRRLPDREMLALRRSADTRAHPPRRGSAPVTPRSVLARPAAPSRPADATHQGDQRCPASSAACRPPCPDASAHHPCRSSYVPVLHVLNRVPRCRDQVSDRLLATSRRGPGTKSGSTCAVRSTPVRLPAHACTLRRWNSTAWRW